MGLLKNIGKSVKKLLGLDEKEEEKTAKKSQSSSASGRKVTVGKTIVTLPTENQKKSSSQKSTSTAKKSAAKSSGADSGRKVAVGKTITTLPTASTKKQTKKTEDQDEGRKITVGKTIVTLPKAGEDRETAFDRVMERAGNTVASGLAGTAAAGTDAARTLLNAMAQSRRSAENIRTPIGITKGNVYANRGYDPFNAARSRRETENLERASAVMNRAAEQMLAREAEAYEAAKAGLGPVGTAAVDIGKAGTELALDAAANLIVPGAGLASMGVRSFGRGVRQAEDEGKSGARAVLYGAGNAAIELGTEKISAAAKPLKAIYGGGALDDVVERLTRKLLGDGRGRQALALIGRSAGGEAAEEAIANVLQVPLQALTLQNGAKFDAEWAADTAYQALIGGVLGGVLGGAGVAVDAAAGRGRNSTAQPRRLEAQLPTYAQAQAARNAVDTERAAVQNEEGGALNGEQGQEEFGFSREYGREAAGRYRNYEVVRGTSREHEIANNTRLKEVALDANGYGTGQENLGEDLRESESGRRIDKAGGNTGAFGDVRYAGVGRPAGSGGIAEIAREYGIETEIVSAEHLAQKGYNQKTGYAKGGKIYVSEQLPEHLQRQFAYHELTHTMKETEFEPYLKFTRKLEEKLIRNEYREIVLNNAITHRKLQGKYDDLDLNDRFNVLDEVNAAIYGGYKENPQTAVKLLSRVMDDPEGYLAELDDILAQYQKSRRAGAESGTVSAPVREIAAADAPEPVQGRKLEARLPTYAQAQGAAGGSGARRTAEKPAQAKNAPKQTVKDLRAERKDVLDQIDRLEWLRERNSGLNAADTAELERLNAREKDLNAQIEAARAERKRTEKKLPETQRIREKTEREAAAVQPKEARKTLRQDLLDTFHIQAGSRKTLGREIDAIGEQVLERGYATASDEADLFRALYNAGVVVDTTASEAYAGVRSELNGARIYVDEETRADLGDDWDAVRKSAFANRIILTTKEDAGGQGIDQLHADLAERYPGLFDYTATDGAEMLNEMIRAAELGKPKHISLMESAIQEGGEDAVAQQMAFFDKYLTDALNNFAKQAGFEVRIQGDAIRKFGKEKELFVKSQTRASEQRALREAHNRTFNAFKRLRKLWKTEGPEMRKAIDDLIGGFDLFAKSMRQDTEAKITDLKAIYDQRRQEDSNFLQDERLEARLGRLSSMKISDLSKEEAMELYRAGTQLIHAIQTEHKEIAEKNARELGDLYSRSAEEIRSSEGAKKTKSKIRKGARQLWNEEQLSPMNYIEKLGGWRRNGTFYSMAQQLERGEYNKQKYIIESDKLLEDFLEKNGDWVAKADGRGKDSIWYEVEVPRVFVRGKGNADLRKMETEKIYLTPAMKAKLYLDTRNEDNLRHIQYGGIKFPDKELYQAGDIQEAYARGKTVRLEPQMVKSIVKDMTEQEKQLAHIIGDLYFNEYAKTNINKTSMLLEGFEKATSRYYSPIYTDKNFLAGKADAAVVDATIEGMGILKSRVRSGTPTLAVSLIDAFQRHQELTAKYVGMAIPVRNMKALLNYTEEGYDDSMKQIIQQQWGSDATEYLDDMLVELQNKSDEKMSVIDRLVNKGVSGYVKAVFGMNPGTVLKQPPGYFMAGARLGFDTMPKTALIRPATRKNRELIAKYTPVLEWRARGNSSRELAELRQNPKWKDKNPAARFLFGGAIQWMDLHTVAAMWPWAENYVKKNFPDLKPGSQKQIDAGTDPYYKKVAEVFDDAVANSQPMYDDMHTAKVMHSQGPVRMLTVFHSAQMAQANALRQAWGEMQRKAEDFRAGRGGVTEQDVKESRKAVTNSVAALTLATVGFEAIAVLVNILKRNGQMRDEEGKYTPESIGMYLADAIGRDLAGNVVGGDWLWDIGTVATGMFGDKKWYGIDNIAIDMVANIITDGLKLHNELGKFMGGISGMDDKGNILYYMKTEGGGLRRSLHDFAIDLSYAAGIPLNNAESYLLAALSWINPDAAVAYKSKFQDYDKQAVTALSGKPREQKAAIRQMVRKSMPGIEKDDLDELVRVYMEATDKTSLLPGGSPDSVSVDGEEIKLKSQQRVDYNRAYTGVLESGMHTLLGSEEYADMTDQEKAAAVGLLYQYADESAKQAAIEGYEMDGWAESAQEAIAAGADPGHTMTFHAATKDMKADKDTSGKAIDGSKARKQTAWLQDSGWSEAEQAALWYACVPTDSTREDLDALRKEGIDRTTLYQYETAAATVEPDKDAAGKTVAGSKNKQLFAEVDALNLDEDRKATLYMARVDDVSDDKYYQQAMDAGIGAWDYVRFKANTGAMASDKDSAGKSISGSKKRKVLAFIDSLDLDSAQKDVLYYAAGYTQSTIGDSPWRGGTVSTGSSGGRSGSSRKTSGGKSSASASRPAGGGEKTQRYLARAGETREQTTLPTPGGGTSPTGGSGGAVQRYLQRGGSGGNVQAYLKRYGE